MHSNRLLVILAILAFSFTTLSACKRKRSDSGSDTGATAPEGAAASTPVVVDPPKNLPPNSLPLPRPVTKAWAQRTQPEKLMVIDYWLNQHQFGDAAQKARVVGEIRAAGLSPADLKVLEETRTRFGYQPIGL